MINNFLKDILFNFLINHKISKEQNNILKKINNLTMTSIRAKLNLIEAVNYINFNNIDGDMIECGVWKGGNLILMNELNEKDKKIIGYDTFDGHLKNQFINEENLFFNISSNFFYKIAQIKNFLTHKKWNYASIKNVEENIQRFCSNAKNIKLIKGDITKTLNLEENLPKKIALLRLDTDWYEPTSVSLKKLFPLLSKGGVLIIDDYGTWSGCKKAVDEYFGNGIKQLFNVDHSVKFLIKY